jgi:GMP synthase (glutamine-hydrolysing)
VNVLAVIHGLEARSEVFGQVVEERGHTLEEWSLAWGEPPPRAIDDYAAVLIFGGAMHADQVENHSWLREETLLLQRLLDQHVPMLGVCLGAQLIARAAHTTVGPASEPEIGWVEVDLTPEAEQDALLGSFPSRFQAFQWHYHTYDLPAGACELARSEICTQAFRLGECCWGIQFHAEVTREQVQRWVEEAPDEVPGSPEALLQVTDELIEEWNGLGRRLCSAFCDVAERVAVAAA